MANKPAPRKWNDIQVAIATVSMAITLVFWNMFAGPDREVARNAHRNKLQLPPPTHSKQPSQSLQAQPSFADISFANRSHYLGGNAPQTQITVVRVEAGWRWRCSCWRRGWRWHNLHRFILMLHRLPFRAMGGEMLAILEMSTDSPPSILDEVPQLV